MYSKHKNLLKYILTLVFLGTTVMFMPCPRVQADNSHYLGVQPIVSDEQYTRDKTYYDFKPNPEQTYNLQVKLTNSADYPLITRIHIASATTNNNGVIDYANMNHKKRDKTLSFELADHVAYQEKIEIPAKSTMDYSFKLTAPNEPFEGLLVGGINFSEEPLNSSGSENKKSGTSIEANYSFLVGIVLHGTTDPVKSDMKLNEVFADLDNYHNSLNGNLSNPTASLLTDMFTEVKVYAKDDKKRKKVLYSDKSENRQMAPNSNFNYNFRIGDGKKIEPGEYTWVQDVRSKQGTWHFEKNFQITAGKADKLNKEDLTIEKPNIWLYVTIILASILLLLIVILLIIMIVRKYQKMKKELEQLKRK
ncbi:MAG: DUF916 and DUF3324 domain-containing protein [Streptococcaceae bacterium]|jgi:hypothetical protein|nr:DUF916 and DUF3324 domain-containing protein [Streptococcaceae bacterium]